MMKEFYDKPYLKLFYFRRIKYTEFIKKNILVYLKSKNLETLVLSIGTGGVW